MIIKYKIKLSYISGLREVVLRELENNIKDYSILDESADSLYVDHVDDFAQIKNLRSVARAYLVSQDVKYNPSYINNHKSILGSIVEKVISNDLKFFKTFKMTCAGADSQEVRSIAEFVKNNFNLIEEEDADLKIHIIKLDDTWEVGAQITPRPMSFRDYKIKNMSGAMDPTIAYAVNSFGELEKADSYLNIFCGSATLLIEAGQCYKNLEKLVGFDNDKKHLSLAMQNIKTSGLIRRIQLKEKDIFDNPDLGVFDVITSDLPFGMSISKNEDLEKLYEAFVEYSQCILHKNGKLIVYTSEHEMLKKIILKSKFKIIHTVELKIITSVDAYLYPKIFVCKFK